MTEKETYPEGHFIGLWVALGAAIFSGVGVSLGITIENPAFFGLGPAIGTAFGAAVGSSIEARYKKEGKIRPLTDKEKKGRRIGLIVLALGILTFILALLFV